MRSAAISTIALLFATAVSAQPVWRPEKRVERHQRPPLHRIDAARFAG